MAHVDIQEIPSKIIMKCIVDDYDDGDAPAIALPIHDHRVVTVALNLEARLAAVLQARLEQGSDVASLARRELAREIRRFGL